MHDVIRTGGTTHAHIDTDLGELTIVQQEGDLRGLYFPHHWHMPNRSTFGSCVTSGFEKPIKQLQEYLAGNRRTFELSLRAVGDESHRRVWEFVAEVPYGSTITYGELARRVGGDATPQTVGAAVGRNPLCLFIPCHRIVGQGGKLTGYAGGINCKQRLLALEAAVAAPNSRLFPLQDEFVGLRPLFDSQTQ